MIAVVDYGRGNLFSIGRALDVIGCEYSITEDPEVIAKSAQVLVPGVGAFGDAMSMMHKHEMVEALSASAKSGHKILGICLGMQLLATKSFEFGEHSGLDLIAGDVVKMPDPLNAEGIRIPNIGWRKVAVENNSDVLDDLDDEPYFYFVHSYGLRCVNAKDLKGTIDVNGERIAAIVGQDNVWGFQFHPEKSGPVGLKLLDNFFNS